MQVKLSQLVSLKCLQLLSEIYSLFKIYNFCSEFKLKVFIIFCREEDVIGDMREEEEGRWKVFRVTMTLY